MENSGNIKHIVILVSPYSTVLDMSGPMDVFQKAIEHFDKAGTQPPFIYKIHTISLGKSKKVRMSSGITILTEGTYKDITYPVDTLIVAGRSPPCRRTSQRCNPYMAPRTGRESTPYLLRLCRRFYTGRCRDINQP